MGEYQTLTKHLLNRIKKSDPQTLENGFNQSFSQSLLLWFDQHGRQSLPWQQQRHPYGIWISEIMLQQTQVETVIPYYRKFMARFPDINRLANAEQDDVMASWAGLGYYARARNLHRAAQHIRDQHNGIFPSIFEQVMALPGIGRSTAGAILAFSANARHPILDGNVKRVLTRYFAIDGHPAITAIENRLWVVADQLTPNQRVADYTQAIMDLGATLCRRRQPDCAHCPIRSGCRALQQGKQAFYPTAKAKVRRPQRYTRMLLLHNADAEYLLVKRPPSGVWGGLWVFPELPDSSVDYQIWCYQQFGISVANGKRLQNIRHSFTHFELQIEAIHCTVNRNPTKTMTATTTDVMNSGMDRVMDSNHYLWYNPLSDVAVGIPAAVQKIFNQLTND